MANPSSAIAPTNKEPWLAVTLSKLLPGLGQLYRGAIVTGLLFLISYLVLTGVGVWSFFADAGSILIAGVCLLISCVLFIVNLVDAYVGVKRANTEAFEAERRRQKDPWLAFFWSTWIAGLGHLYLGKWLQGIGWLLLVVIIAALLPASLVGLTSLVATAIAYHAYRISPVKRESSPRTILMLCAAIAAVSILVPNAVTIRNTIAEARYIPSRSMTPTLQVNDRVLVNKLTYRVRDPQRGDIIVFIATEEATTICQGGIQTNRNQDVRIARLIGLPNERIAIKQGQVFVGDRPLQEPYIQEPPDYVYGPKTIPPGQYFVLGDNRNNACDSHYWGFVPRDNIIGRASKIFWPLDRSGALG